MINLSLKTYMGVSALSMGVSALSFGLPKLLVFFLVPLSNRQTMGTRTTKKTVYNLNVGAHDHPEISRAPAKGNVDHATYEPRAEATETVEDYTLDFQVPRQ